MSAATGQRHGRGEAARLLLLLAAAAWLLHPFVTGRQLGAGDALWYANMLADYVLQLRAGVFPVFAGQTLHAFNGAVYPLRVAPLYQHLAGAIDLLTFHRLGFFALQPAVVVACGLGGIFGCYFALAAVAPARLWSAAWLAILYLSCPGVLATIYTQDLYMTWTAVPFLPLACYGIVRTYRRDDWIAQAWLAAPLAALWWAHSPVALWMSAAAAGTQLIRLAGSWGGQTDRRAMVRRAAGEILRFPRCWPNIPSFRWRNCAPPGAASVVAASPGHFELIPATLRSALPRALLPLTANAMSLGDLQLGYGLWLTLLLAALVRPAGRSERRAGRALLACCAGFLFLLAPIPGVSPWVWAHFPTAVKTITFYWPMQRFYPILAAFVVFAAQLVSLSGRRLSPLLFSAFLAAGLGWALWESRLFIRAGHARTASPAASEIALRPENLLLMDHSYGLFRALPAYYSDGVMDPQAETRLLDPRTLRPFATPSSPGALLARWKTSIDANPGILDLRPAFHLLPGRRYELQFAFADPKSQGVLELTGRSFFRQYLLPSSGQPLSFGSGPDNSHQLILWTSDPAGDEVSARFIPTAPGDSPKNHRDFGRFALRELDASSRPVQLESLLPFRAAVEAPIPAWLETPRMFMPGYAASVDGRPAPVRDSPLGLASIPLPAGQHEVELRFAGPLPLWFSYWAAGVAWGLCLAAGVLGLIRRRRSAILP